MKESSAYQTDLGCLVDSNLRMDNLCHSRGKPPENQQAENLQHTNNNGTLVQSYTHTII